MLIKSLCFSNFYTIVVFFREEARDMFYHAYNAYMVRKFTVFLSLDYGENYNLYNKVIDNILYKNNIS